MNAKTALHGTIALAVSLGVSSVALAAQPSGVLPGSTDFELIDIEDTYFADVGESTITEDATVESVAKRPAGYYYAATRSKVLKVESSSDPLLRYIDSTNGVATTGTIYADMLLKCSDVVSTETTPSVTSEDDQLLVYFKETSAGVTNLCVYAGGYVTKAGKLEMINAETNHFTLTASQEFDKNTWYRLIIVSRTVNGKQCFQIYCGGYGNSYLCKNDQKDTFLSLKADAEGISAFGFQGSGSVDDFVISSNEPITWADLLGDAVDGAYEIDDLAELKKFQEGVDKGLSTADETFKLTADIALDAAWPGIGIQNGKDLAINSASASNQAKFEAGAFKGTFDGQGYTISNFQMVGVADNPANNDEGLDYCGFFNSTMNATIKNFKIAYKDGKFAIDTTSSTKESGATFVGVAKASMLQGLTSVAGTVSISKGFGGIVGYLMAGTTVDSCTNNVNLTSLASNKAGGIAMITQSGTGAAVITNCVNNGTTAGNNNQKGGIVGYVGANTTIADCTDTAGSTPSFLSYNTGTLTVTGENKAPASVLPCKTTGGAAKAVSGLTFALVDNDVATFVADSALAAGNTYKVFAPGTATYEFAAAGTIAFDTALATPTYAITVAEGLELTDATEGTVKTYTAAVAQIAYPEYLEGADADIKAAYDAWKTTYGADTESAYENQFLMNVSPETEVGDKALEITAIEQAADGSWDITVGSAIEGAALTGTVASDRVSNGYLAITYAATLEALLANPTTENIPVSVVDSADGTVTVNVDANGAAFFKAELNVARESAE